jgi:DNA-binding NarL/FixJ family response regulator
MLAAPIRLLLVDDHCMFLEALQLVLERTPGFEVIATAANIDEGVRLANELRPDIVLCDVQFPERGVFHLADELQMLHVPSRLVILTGHATDALIESALRVRASGYLLKTDPIQELTLAITRIAAGETYFSETIRDRLNQDLHGLTTVKSQTPLSRLNNQQIEVLRHLARGLSVKEVARLMHATVKAIDSQKYRLMKSLGIHDRVLLAHFAVEHELISRDQLPAQAH